MFFHNVEMATATLLHKSNNNSGTLYQIENYVALHIESIVVPATHYFRFTLMIGLAFTV